MVLHSMSMDWPEVNLSPWKTMICTFSIPRRCGGCRAWSNATDSRSVSAGIRRFESGPPHIYIELLKSHSQITSRPCTFPNTGSLEISDKLRVSASAAINLSCSSGISRERKISHPASGKLDWNIKEIPLSSSRTRLTAPLGSANLSLHFIAIEMNSPITICGTRIEESVPNSSGADQYVVSYTISTSLALIPSLVKWKFPPAYVKWHLWVNSREFWYI